MPYYMDFHQFDSVTVEDVKQAHIADLAVQEKYGVRYLQFWVNEEAGTVFCLTEGPDPKSCEACHQEAHGNIPCNIQEVEPGFFKLFMGDGLSVDHGVTLNKEGKADTASRTLLVCDIRGITTIENVKEYKELMVSGKAKNLVVDSVKRFNGHFIEHSVDDNLIAVFNSPFHAISCARSISDYLLIKKRENPGKSEWNLVFRMAVNQGQPMTEREGFFEAAMRQTRRMCLITGPDRISLSANLRDLYEKESASKGKTVLQSNGKIFTAQEENFINDIFELTEQNISEESFNVNSLCKLIGLSRPQLYRKTINLTGKSPGDFITEQRMVKAWKLLKSKSGNISEIAFQVGYSNPSYFSKIFNESFGCSPSAI